MAAKRRPNDVAPVEIAPAEPVTISESTTIYRLFPAFEGAGIQRAAFIAANTEQEARSFAARNDPFGVDWTDTLQFKCECDTTEELHAIGDVWFVSRARSE